jgi:hypothetical protein
MMTAHDMSADSAADLIHEDGHVLDAVDVSAVPREPSTRFTRLLTPLRWAGRSRSEASGTTASTVADAEVPGAGAGEAPGHLELLKLVQRLFLPVGLASDGFRSVVFASMTPWTDAAAADTAETLVAYTGRRVCLVDANVRDPILHRRFAVDNSLGWADVVSGVCPASEAAVSVRPKLWLVTAGLRRPDRETAPDHLRQGVASLIAQFDFVVFSAGMTDCESETAQLGALTDGLVMVLDGASVRRDDATRTLEQLRAARTRVLGAVLRSAPSSHRRKGGAVHE